MMTNCLPYERDFEARLCRLLCEDPNIMKIRSITEENEVIDFISSLLQKIPTHRLGRLFFIYFDFFYKLRDYFRIFVSGNEKKGYKDVQKHSFFLYVS